LNIPKIQFEAVPSLAYSLACIRGHTNDIGTIGIQNRPLRLGDHDAGPRRRLEGRGECPGVVAEHDALPVIGPERLRTIRFESYEICLTSFYESVSFALLRRFEFQLAGAL